MIKKNSSCMCSLTLIQKSANSQGWLKRSQLFYKGLIIVVDLISTLVAEVNLHNYFNLQVCKSVRPSVQRPVVIHIISSVSMLKRIKTEQNYVYRINFKSTPINAKLKRYFLLNTIKTYIGIFVTKLNQPFEYTSLTV